MHIEELPSGPRPIESPPTAVAGFVGYTEHALDPHGASIHLTPTRVGSFVEFEQCFGVPFNGPARTPDYVLGWAVRLFFENGGRHCMVVSVGSHGEPRDAAALVSGIQRLATDDDVTLLAVPDAATLPVFDDYRTVVAAMLEQCGTRRDRIALIDVWNGQLAPEALVDVGPPGGVPVQRTVIAASRSAVTAHLMFGAAFYPFIETHPAAGALHLPPSGAIAGAFAEADSNRGVWTAPTGTSLSLVSRPVVPLSDPEQEGLHVDLVSGKSINAVRAFTGRGTVPWGARTLQGNDAEWRYIPVRRLVMFIETAVSRGTRWAVFEPNAQPLWAALRESAETFLTPLWRNGALHGVRPQEAFAVRCGLGQTMTEQDVQDGRVILDLLLAVSRPAEFITVRVVQQIGRTF